MIIKIEDDSYFIIKENVDCVTYSSKEELMVDSNCNTYYFPIKHSTILRIFSDNMKEEFFMKKFN